MAKTRVEIVQEKLHEFLTSVRNPTALLESGDSVAAGSTLTAARALGLFEDQVRSRLLDVAARELRKTNQSFYTISSAGHEQNTVFGALLRADDPCFLHYRSGGLMMARSRLDPSCDPIVDGVRSFCASAADPVSGGRHKVWGSPSLWVPPQTSTIASHLPKAYGMAYALRRARKIGVAPGIQDDSIVLCSFGDASLNHATALTGINAARYAVRRGGRVPILFLCEDNGLGISVETPPNWVRDNFRAQPHLAYFELSGDIDAIWEGARAAIDHCRRTRSPVFVHLHTVRLWGHAGTDVETSYRPLAEIEAAEARDPLLANARRLIELGVATPAMLQRIVTGAQERIDAACAQVTREPKLTSAAQIVAPLAPFDAKAIRDAAASIASDPAERTRHFDSGLPEETKSPVRRTMAAHINAALADEMLRHAEISLFGEDVGRKGGVYGVTGGLQAKFGPARVFDTLLDETTILGTAQGAGLAGMLPVPEIQYLAYIHNALDQLRGEACSLQFFSNGRYRNPMVVRVQGLGYQRGFGGHFHNDNSIGALRDIPGLIVATPSRGDDAAMMLRGLIAAARTCGRVAVFLEPIALYHERDLFAEGDNGWLSDYPAPGKLLLPGEIGVHNPGARDILIISYANGLRLSIRAARKLAEEGIAARVLDVRWLNPLPLEAIRKHASECRRVLVADECRATGGGIADAVIASLAEGGHRGPMASVRSADTYIPLAAAANLVLVSEAQILEAALRVMAGDRG